MNKHAAFIRPLLTVASACIVPPVHAQDAAPADAVQPVQAARPSGPSVPSAPSAPTLPTTPSQPAGVPYPSRLFDPAGAFQPAGTQASAVSEDVPEGLQLRVTTGLESESNVLRTQSHPVSDTALLLGLGLRVDRRFGRQRLRADVEANSYRYRRQSSLDYNILNYALAWDWAVGRRFHGVLAADRKAYREVLTDPVALVNRVGRRTERTELVEGVVEAGAALRLSGTLQHTSASSSEPGSWDASPEVTSARVGVGYELASGTSLYGRYRRGHGEYTDPTPGAPSGGFAENEMDVVLRWPVSGKTSIDARLGRLERRHDSASQRDFAGLVGSAAMTWDVTGKTRIAAGVSRDIGASGLAAGGHVRSDRIFIGPTWKATPALAVQLRYDHVARIWQDVPGGSADAGRKDVVRVLSGSVEWQPRRWLAVSGYVRGERQSSDLNTGYRDTTVGAAIKTFF